MAEDKIKWTAPLPDVEEDRIFKDAVRGYVEKINEKRLQLRKDYIRDTGGLDMSDARYINWLEIYCSQLLYIKEKSRGAEQDERETTPPNNSI